MYLFSLVSSDVRLFDVRSNAGNDTRGKCFSLAHLFSFFLVWRLHGKSLLILWRVQFCMCQKILLLTEHKHEMMFRRKIVFIVSSQRGVITPCRSSKSVSLCILIFVIMYLRKNCVQFLVGEIY